MSKVRVVTEYGVVTGGGTSGMFMKAVVSIIRGDEILEPYLERNVTISGNKMIIDIPLLTLQGMELKTPRTLPTIAIC